jgi:hypothetical protein
MNIFQKMSAVTAELQTVAKNLTVSTGGKNSYKAVSERDIIDAVKPIEIKHGIYSYPFDRQIIESQTLESESEYQGKVTKKTTFFSRIKTTYRFVNIEKPDEYIDMVTFAEGIDPQDKGSGKAMTYADKYALMKAYKISTGDDPDQNASEEIHYSNVRAGNAEKPKAKNNLPPRDQLIARLKELNINVKAYAEANNIHPGTSDEVYLKCLRELRNA